MTTGAVPSESPVSSTVCEQAQLGCGCWVIPGFDIGGRIVACQTHGGRWNVTSHRKILVSYTATPCPEPLQ